ncbi:MAG: hypothetical protein R3A10_08620 [Caldilineaceae bacterium]
MSITPCTQGAPVLRQPDPATQFAGGGHGAGRQQRHQRGAPHRGSDQSAEAEPGSIRADPAWRLAAI